MSNLSLIAEAFTEDFRLHKFQRLLFTAVEKHQRVCMVASRQIGKTEAICRLATAWAQTYPKQLILVVSAGERQASEVLKRIKRIIQSQKFSTELSKESATELEFAQNQSRLLSLPNSPNTIRGYPANLLLIDETDSITHWEEFVSALWPSVSRTNGKILCSGTYHGKQQLYNLTKDPKWQTLVFPWTVNPPVDIEQQRHDLLPYRFAQEFECIPIDASSSLFPYEMLAECINSELQAAPIMPNPKAYYVAGYDPAKTHDASIFTILEELHLDEKRVVRLVYSTNLSGNLYSQQADTIAQWHKRFYLSALFVDATGVGNGVMELVAARLSINIVKPVVFTQNTKIELISFLRVAFQDKLLQIPNDPILLRELHDLDPNTLDHRSGGSSDRVWALALAWFAYKSIAHTLLGRNSIEVVPDPDDLYNVG